MFGLIPPYQILVPYLRKSSKNIKCTFEFSDNTNIHAEIHTCLPRILSFFKAVSSPLLPCLVAPTYRRSSIPLPTDLPGTSIFLWPPVCRSLSSGERKHLVSQSKSKLITRFLTF
ncbi:unnamed protein product [Lactuca virosa]|uniref:Uncharacterized protein n=1 Tax=Lactuca virosa TaxID=75947 RepID=A0AAU9PHW9_9ASTR|nr:unnamed protein product [Lactuca virosa]